MDSTERTRAITAVKLQGWTDLAASLEKDLRELDALRKLSRARSARLVLEPVHRTSFEGKIEIDVHGQTFIVVRIDRVIDMSFVEKISKATGLPVVLVREDEQFECSIVKLEPFEGS